MNWTVHLTKTSFFVAPPPPPPPPSFFGGWGGGGETVFFSFPLPGGRDPAARGGGSSWDREAGKP